MSTQQDPTVYSQCIQWQLTDILSPVPVYAVFNRNYAKQPKFVTWQLRNVHQSVYTGQTQNNKGIDSPTFQATVFAQNMNDAFNLSNTILQSLHGYSGMFGDPTDNGFFVAKVDCVWLYNTYDNELGLNQIILDCTFYVPT